MTGVANKLKINTSYLLFTNYNTISTQKVKVVGIINYEQTLKLSYSVTGMSINEKVVELSEEYGTDTEEYLRNQLYYKCVALNDDNKEKVDQIYLVWDDIIDTTRTTQLNTEYNYNLRLIVNNNLTESIDDIKKEIETFIEERYKKFIDVNMSINRVISRNDTKAMLDDYMEKFEDARILITKMANLKQIETLIEMLVSGKMMDNINDISGKLSTINDTCNSISALIS